MDLYGYFQRIYTSINFIFISNPNYFVHSYKYMVLVNRNHEVRDRRFRRCLAVRLLIYSSKGAQIGYKFIWRNSVDRIKVIKIQNKLT